MKELNRTGVFVAVAVVLSVLTFLTRPSTKQLSPASMVGKALFPDFQDPLTATSLEIVRFDKGTATANTFKVAKVGDSWVIPSHSNYPADAKDQLADVAAEWINLEVLGVATDPEESGIQADDVQGLHKLYGVIDPVGEDTSDADGVGTRVIMRDKSDGQLVRLIVGKEVEGQAGLRYVRRVGQDPVLTVKVNTSKLSTKFEDWIEDDLLKLSSWDIRKVDIEDYSIDILQQVITPRGQLSLAYNDTGDPRWNLTVDRVYGESGWTERGLAETEELNSETLNNLKSALDDLKIVDVVRKPKGLSETLKATGPMKLDPEAKNSLSRAGFHVVQVSDPANPGQPYSDLRSNEGEISVAMKDGVSYVLRFGQVAGMGSEDEDEKKEAKPAEKSDQEAANKDKSDAEKKDESSSSKVNRYLFVVAQMDPGMIEEPKYEELPELPSEDAKPEENKPAEKKEDAAKADKPEAAKPDEAKADAKKEEAKDAKPAEAKDAKPEEAKPEEAKPEAKPDEVKADSDKAPGGEAPKAKEKEAEEGAAAKKPEAKKPEEKKPTREEIEKKRAEIQKENDRKKTEYEESIKKSEEKVKELNARFADWYYIIDDAEYQKIHLGRDKIVKIKEKKEEKSAEGTDAKTPVAPAQEPDSLGEFENLKLEGPEKK